MKKTLLIFCLGAFAAHAQQTIHSVMNGNASNPFVWDCTCFPTPDDIIIVDHQITMDVDWAVTSGGRIEVSNGAALSQDANRQLLIDGNGSQLIINGTAVFTDIAFTNNASGSNSGNLYVDRGLYFGATTSFTNNTDIHGIDSLMTEGTFTNNGTFFAGNFLNTGSFTNTGHIAADSMGNTGTFSANNGYMVIATFGNTGTFTIQTQGFMEVTSNWYNAGEFTVGAATSLNVGGNAYTGDTLGGTATLTVNGGMSVGLDFGSSDEVNGSGDICVGGYSANAGNVTGTLDFCDPSALAGFDLNVGTIAGTVTFCTSGCALGIPEETVSLSLVPNPASTTVTINSSAEVTTVSLWTVSGVLVHRFSDQTQLLDVSDVAPGIYLLNVQTTAGTVIERLVIE